MCQVNGPFWDEKGDEVAALLTCGPYSALPKCQRTGGIQPRELLDCGSPLPLFAGRKEVNAMLVLIDYRPRGRLPEADAAIGSRKGFKTS